MENKKSKIKDKKWCLRGFLFVFFIFSFLSFILAVVPVRAEGTDRFIVGSTCFRKDECTSPTYKGLLGPKDPFCNKDSPLHSEGAIQRGFNYNCYTKPVPYKLQVPFLVPGFFGTANSLELYLEQLYKFLIGISGVLAGIMIIYAGVKWLTSAGNPEKITEAKHKIAGACVGLVLVLSSYLLLNTINPDLVHLRLPPVKLIRQVGEVKETKCRAISQFPCGGMHTEPLYTIEGRTPPPFFQPENREAGSYRCDSHGTQNPCGDAEVSDCTGQYCEKGGCWDIDEERITQDAKDLLKSSPSEFYVNSFTGGIPVRRACFNQGFCNGCEIPIRIEPGPPRQLSPEGDRQLRLCASKACECLVSVRKDASGNDEPYCTKRKSKNEQCSKNVECEEGLQCVSGDKGMGNVVDPGTAGICGAPQADGYVCHEASDCASGMCGTTGLAYICVGNSHGSYCGRGGQCANGLLCVDTAGPGGKCSDGRPGAPCCADFQCSGRNGCEGNVNIMGNTGCAWAGHCR